jgi:hypothetical protein
LFVSRPKHKRVVENRGNLLNNVSAQIGRATRACRLEVGRHQEDPATGELDQGFPWFYSVLEQMLSWYSNSMFQAILLMQPSQFNIKIPP